MFSGGELMKKVYDNCRGVDVHNRLIIVVCFKHGKEIRQYGTATHELL